MNQVGSVALIAALAFAVYGVIAGAAGGKLRSPRIFRSAERAVVAFLIVITIAVVVLEFLIFTDDFHNSYVARHSNRDLPGYFKIAVLWGGQEGSLLFWTWLLALYAACATWYNRQKNRQLMPYAISMLMGTATFFSALIFFAANPFHELALVSATGMEPFRPADGGGLNPLLQYPQMVIHPPMLYLGFVGFAVPFAFAMSALLTKQLGDNWIRTTRFWTMIPWMFLGLGILLGGNWAYAVLGWGGYWGWDPVENASLLPWLSGTAFLHSVMIQEKRGMLKVWNVVLIILTFFLCIFGTFLTRSGIVSSVHAFAQSAIGPFFAVFLAIIVLFSVTVLFLRLDFLKSENRLDSVVSRESGFLFNNWVLLAAIFAVLWGTLFPIVSKAVKDVTVTVGAPYFNKVTIPMGLVLLFLTGAGPLLAWRKTSWESLRRAFRVPVAVSVAAGVAFLIAGIHHLYAWMTLFLCVFVAACTFQEFYKGARTRMQTTRENFALALYNLTMKNTRRYGGFVIHLGVVLLFVGFAGQAFQKETKGLMGEGDTIRVGDYVLRARALVSDEYPNYIYQRMELSATKSGRALGVLKPERRFYKTAQQPTSMVAIKTMPQEDLYVVLGPPDPDTGKATVEVFVNPLVMWVWVGAAVIFFGTLLALIPSKVERQLNALRREREEALTSEHVG
jgi:cytochrome c-type biogenesis protein CcmF